MKKLLSLLFLLSFSLTSLATDGYFSLGYGALHKGLAGAGIGLHYTSLINGNPAGNVFAGKNYSVGVSLFMPNRKYTIEGNPSGLPGTFGLTPGTVESDSKVFFVPHIAGNWMIGDRSSFAVSVFGHGGMNTNYPTQTFYDQSVTNTGVNLSQLFMGLSYAYMFAEDHSIGVTAQFVGQFFSSEGLSAFGGFSSDPTALTNNGSNSSFGVGYKIGYFGKISEYVNVSLMYQSKAKMSKFDDYAGLFAEQGGFDIPASWSAGVALMPSDVFRILIDSKHIFYSGVASIGNPMNLRTNAPADPMGNPNPNFKPLGDDEGWGFGWDDMLVFKFGLEYDVSDALTLRGGFSTGDQPIPTSEVLFNILAPGVIDNHIALGFSKRLGDSHRKLHFSFNYALNNSVEGFNPLDFDAAQAMQGNFVPNQMVTLEMKQFDFEIQYTF